MLGRTIPAAEMVLSIFEEHTRWCAKGKAGVLAELGVPVSVVERSQQLVAHWQVMWTEDMGVVCPLVNATQRIYPSLERCSFDKGYHSPANREGLDRKLKRSVLPKKGGCGPRSRRARERRRSGWRGGHTRRWNRRSTIWSSADRGGLLRGGRRASRGWWCWRGICTGSGCCCSQRSRPG